MYRRILIPTDGSACSEPAIRQGLALARQLGAEVTFLYALEDPIRALYAPEAAAYRPELYAAMKRLAQEALASAENQAREAGVDATTVLAELTGPVAAIHEAEGNVDLVVMGTHGRRGFDRLVFGSVAEGALRRSTKPYLMVRAEQDGNEAEV